jgi:phosphoglycerate dehydrogenase-like enzyme
VAKIVMSPPLPKAIIDLAYELLPPGYELTVIDQQAPEFAAALKDADYYMGFARLSLAADFYRGAPKLKLVQLISAGYDRVDIEAARKAGVPVANPGTAHVCFSVPDIQATYRRLKAAGVRFKSDGPVAITAGANSVAVAEATLMLILSVLKKLAWQHNNVMAGRWRVGDFSETRLYEASGKTLGIVGLGTIGKKVARRARAFDVKVQYYDVVRLTEDQEDALGVRFVLFEELLKTSDIVSLHVPLNAQTRNLMSTKQFAMMKDTAILINTCRGPVVDENALYQALKTRQILAAGLDVMTEEPPAQKHPLYTLDNVTITPHTAGPTWENWAKAFRNAFDNIQRVAGGAAPYWLIPELRA